MLALVATALVLLRGSGAAPVFSAPDPELKLLAAVAWEQIAECAGREAPAEEVVAIRPVDEVAGGFVGRAFTGPEGLYEIRLHRDRFVSGNLLHEVAHAWVHEGPPVLVEGFTQALTDCAAARHPEHWNFKPDRPLVGSVAPDLLTWVNADAPVEGSRSYGYSAARRLAHTIVWIVGIQTALDERVWTSWARAREFLLASGPDGELLVSLMEAGAASQHAALADHDHDGLPSFLEAVLGSSPDTWDSDGDGWWDGANIVQGAEPLAWGRTVCLGTVTAGDAAQVVWGRDLTAWCQVSPRLTLGGRAWHSHNGGTTPPDRGGAVLARLPELPEDAAGGVWAMLLHVPVSEAPACVARDGIVVLARTPALYDAAFLEGVAAAVGPARDRAIALGLEPPSPRHLVTDTGRHDLGKGTVRAPARVGVWAHDARRPDVVATYALARSIAGAKAEDGLLDALAAAMLAPSPLPPVLSGSEVTMLTVTEAAEACGGWDALLARRCGVDED